MLPSRDYLTLDEASADLMQYIRVPENWVAGGTAQSGANPDYHRSIGPLRLWAAVDVSDALAVRLRVSFRAPGLTPMEAVQYLEAFLKGRMALLPNAEWQVEIDGRRWIHFSRRYLAEPLRG